MRVNQKCAKSGMTCQIGGGYSCTFSKKNRTKKKIFGKKRKEWITILKNMVIMFGYLTNYVE